MELALIIVAALLFGAFVALVFCMFMIYDSHKRHVIYMHDEILDLQHQLKCKVKDFEEVVSKASAANLSWGQAITDFDQKIKDIENRVAMVRMQR